MKRWLVTFSGPTYDETTEHIVTGGPRFGADEVIVFDDAWFMAHQFWSCPGNAWLKTHHHKYPNGLPRGMCWYTWKALCIIEAMSRASPGDVVAYCDADTFPVADFSVMYEVAARDTAMLFAASGHNQHRWCKRDAYIILAQDKAEYHTSVAGNARYMSFLVGPWKPRQFLYEWLTYCVNETATTFDPSILAPELEGFTESRSEQAIMTLLAHKYGYKLHRECCEGGEGWPEDRDMYGQIFSQVHQRNGAPPTGSKFAGRWDKTGRIGDL